jgi:hypothetical protein
MVNALNEGKICAKSGHAILMRLLAGCFATLREHVGP